MPHHAEFRQFRKSARAFLLWQKMISKSCLFHFALWVTLAGLVFDLSLLREQVEAAWQPGEITVGDGKGGTTAYPVQKQNIKVPGYNYVIPGGLVQMDDGRIILLTSLETEKTHKTVASYSSDGGETWTEFQAIPPVTGRPGVLTYLGGGNLSLYGTGYFSSDYGKTWSIQGPIEKRYLANAGNAAVDRDKDGKAIQVMETSWNYNEPHTWTHGGVLGFQTSFRSSTDGGHTWSAPVSPPNWHFDDTDNGKTYTLGSGEGSVVRAANGWLVAALRTDPPARYTAEKMSNDNLCGTAVSISKDNGETCSDLNRLFNAGRHHADLRLLPNGDLLMTMILREDIKFGDGLASEQRGEDALISHDNGQTWNLDHRITIDAFNSDHPTPSQRLVPAVCGHIATAVLKDGTVLTAYGNYLDSAAVMTKWNPAVIDSK